MTSEERYEHNINSLPGSLEEALKALEKDQVILDALGEHIWDRFREAKTIEWDNYRTQVHQWEVDRYLAKLKNTTDVIVFCRAKALRS